MKSSSFSLKNPLGRFLLIAFAAYLLWYALYEFYLKPETGIDEWVIALIVDHASKLLQIFGFVLRTDEGMAWNHIAIEGSSGVLIGAPCDGIILLAIFTVFVLSFPGPIKHKTWFLPLGIISIHLVNVLRVIALAWIVSVNEEWLSFNHDYTFTILTYAWVFLLWYCWVNRFSPLKQNKA